MATARKKLINCADTTIYHCITRCVRRARLCGKDPLTHKDYEYRRHWVEQRLHQLQTVFSLEVLAYAVMPNHTHLLLHIDVKTAEQYPDIEVIRRWHKLFRGTLLTHKFISANHDLSDIEKESVRATVAVWRQRLTSVSWFMKALNEYIAKKANKEDDCTGHFWEGRFKSQAILDETALLACMLYIDLNPVRAGLASTPESSEFTSLKYRLKNNQAKCTNNIDKIFNTTGNGDNLISVTFEQYLMLIDETARCVIKGKSAMNADLLPIMERLQVESTQFLNASNSFESSFSQIAGNVHSMQKYARYYNRRQMKGTFCLTD